MFLRFPDTILLLKPENAKAFISQICSTLNSLKEHYFVFFKIPLIMDLLDM